MSESEATDVPVINAEVIESLSKPKTKKKPRGYSLTAVFLLVTVCAVIGSMIHSGMRAAEANWRESIDSTSVREKITKNQRRISFAERVRHGSSLSEGDAVGLAVFCTCVGFLVGAVVGAQREPKGQNVAVGIGVGITFGLVATAMFLFPPTPAALVLGCLLLVGTAGVLSRLHR